MRVKKFCAILLCFVIVFAINIPSVFALDESVVYSDFEDCIDKIKSPWRAQGHSTTAPVSQTERGVSVVLETLPGKMQEVFCDFPKTSENVKTVVIRFGIKLCDSLANRGVLSRTDEGEFGLISLLANGDVSIGGVTLPDIKIERNAWYDIYAVYLPLTGEIRLAVDDGQNVNTATGICSAKDKKGLWRINFAAFANKDAGTTTYIDDVCVYTLDYVPNSFVGSTGEFYNFDDYSATDGKTPPDGWLLQNLGNGNASGMSVDSGDGKAIECRTDGTKNFELVKYFKTPIEGDGSIEFDFKREAGSGVRMGIRARDASGTQLTKFFMLISSDGDLTVDDIPVSNLKEEVWYRLGYHFNTDTHTYTFTVESEDECFSVDSTVPENYVKMVAFEFFTPPVLGKSAFVVDNVFIGKKQQFGVSSITPNFTTISALADKIEFTYSGNVSDVASGATFTLNGDSSYFDGYKTEGKKIILDLAKPLDYGKSYLFEVKNLGDNENAASAVAIFLTEKQFSYTNHMINVSSDSATATVSAKASDGETYKITLLLAIYNKETGEMVDLVATNSEFSSEEASLSVSLPFPYDRGLYEAYAYVWDGAHTMQSLTAPKILNVE